MKNTFLRFSFTFAAIACVALFSSFKTSNNKITICHIPPGNPGNCHEITISVNALDAHLDHGDTFYCDNEDQYDTIMNMLEANPTANATVIIRY